MKNYVCCIFGLLLCLGIASCSGEDGMDGNPGLDGAPGLNGGPGLNGAPGADGTDGENGIGFEELTRFGYITSVLEGVRADNVPFKDSTSYRFSRLDGTLANAGSLIFDVGESSTAILALRYWSVPETQAEFENETTLQVDLIFDNLGEAGQELNTANIIFNNYAVIGDDNKYFVIDNNFSSTSVGVSDFEISNFIFDEETREVSFSYSLTVDENFNITGNELSISGMADLIFPEEIE